MDGRQFHANVH
jgi:5-methylcytosine-specific restriction endonuclease McrA